MRKQSNIPAAIILGILALGGGALLRHALSNNSTGSAISAGTLQNSSVPQAAFPSERTNSTPQNAILQISAKDYKDTSTIYSTLTLSIPVGAFTSATEIKASAAPPAPCGNLSGAYLLFPQGEKLLVPATVSITYTDAAVALHEKCYSDFKETNLTLAYYDNSLYKYVSVQSAFNPSTRTVSGSIAQFYSGGVMIVPTSLIH